MFKLIAYNWWETQKSGTDPRTLSHIKWCLATFYRYQLLQRAPCGRVPGSSFVKFAMHENSSYFVWKLFVSSHSKCDHLYQKSCFSLLLFTARWSTFKLPFRCLLPLSCFYWSSLWLLKVKIPLVSLKLVSAIFIKFLFFHQMIALQKLWKMLFISSKKLFLFSRYSIFCISVLPSLSTCRSLLWRMIKDKS